MKFSESGLAQPTRVYMDTAHLVLLADEGGRLWACFKSLVEQGAIVPVLSYIHLTERVLGPIASLARLDSTITPLLQRGYGLWVRDFNTVQRIEIETELARQGFGAFETLTPCVPTIVELLPECGLDLSVRFPG